MAKSKIPNEFQKEILEAVKNGNILLQFNKKVMEDLKQRTGSYQGGWATRNSSYTINNPLYGDNWINCSKCGESTERHLEDGKCPIIIDGKFMEEEQPKLPSGKGD